MPPGSSGGHARPYTEPVLENPRSPRVRAVAKLTKRSARQETGLFLLEGPQAAREALAYRPETVIEVFATPSALERHADLRDAARDAGVEVVFTTEGVLDAMADTVTPQGIVAVARQTPTSVRDVFAASPRLVAICEEVRDPGNLGTIIRAADAAGADAVILTGRTVDPYNPKVVRATTGSLFHLPIAVGVDLANAVERAHAAGVRVVAADVGRRGLPRGPVASGRAHRVAVRQRGARPRRGVARARRPLAAPADLRQRGVAEPGDGGERVPVRDGFRAALRHAGLSRSRPVTVR